MARITSFVFFDIETTGLPWQERNKTKITELCFVATSRKDIEETTVFLPPVSKLTLVLNPQKSIHPEVTAMTGLTNEFLRYAPTFSQKSGSIVNFLNDLPKPICMVAHNGNNFDYKIFLAECRDARVTLPSDILCIDSLVLFRKLLKSSAPIKAVQNIGNDMWPELDVTLEDWESFDDLCSPVKGNSINSTPKDDLDLENLLITDDEGSDTEEKMLQEYEKIEQRKAEALKNLFGKSNKNIKNQCESKYKSSSIQSQGSKTVGNKIEGRKKGEFTLSGIYRKLLHKEFNDAHRAENDCFALLECVVATKGDFLPLADESCKKLLDIKPLQRY